MSRTKVILASTIAALASIASYASLYMFHFGMINFWILPVTCAVYGFFWAIKNITENSEKDFNRGHAIKFYALASAIFFPLLALCFPSFMFNLCAQLCVVSLVNNIHQLYKGERSKGPLDLIETLMKNPEDFQNELLPLQQTFRFQAVANVAFILFNTVGSFTLSSEIFISILLGICITSVAVELIKDIALPSSKLENISGDQTLSNVMT